ncbi:hypothetical protein ACHAWF_009005 [Thalassiosira exigua]
MRHAEGTLKGRRQTCQPGQQKQNKRRSKLKTMVLTEKERDRLLKLIVLRLVPECVRSEYRSMSRAAAKLFLDALDSMINHFHHDAIHADVMERSTSSIGFVSSRVSKGKMASNPSCPLSLLLSGYAGNNNTIFQEHVDKIKQKISTWGNQSELTSPFFLAMRDMQVEKEYMEMKKSEGKKNEAIEFHKSTVLGTKVDSSDFQWHSLSTIGVGDLKLFESCKESVLRGILIATPVVMTGVTTFLRDDVGGIVQIGLYNFVPGKMSRLKSNEYVRNHLPKGTRVEIAEPFTKIFLDGNRGVRIDNPNEFRIEGGYRGDVASAREEGNQLFKENMYFAASETYIAGLQNDTLVATLLSNRSQAYIKLEKWADALADAAASLTIRPSVEKTYLRYQKALQGLNQQGLDKDELLHVALKPTRWERGTGKGNQDPDGLKLRGNTAFKCGDFERAIEIYTSALLFSKEDVRAVLSNWSQSSIMNELYHEAVAASAASLRIRADDKAVYRLCTALAQLNETKLSMDILHCYGGSAAGLEDLKSNISRYSTALVHTGMRFMETSREISPDFASDNIESFWDPKTGRGIRAAKSMLPGHLILIESPLAASFADLKSDKSLSFTIDHGRTVNDKAQSLLESTIMNRMRRDQLLSQRVDNLYDGKTSRPLVSIKDLLKTMGVSNAPLLLPPWPEFFENKVPALSADRVRNILNTNSFGFYDREELNIEASSLSKKESHLYSAISMFNHSFTPNCMIRKLSGSSRAVVTCIPVEEGEELCISYHHDPEVLKRKWGIEK